MAVDRPAGDYPEEIRSTTRDRHDDAGPSAEGVPKGAEIATPRLRAESYQALRAAADQHGCSVNAGGATETRPRSAWDHADALTRPPLDALRVPPERAVHILDGDATGGGHRYGIGKPGKTEFPASWDDDKIIDSMVSVARAPDSASLQRNGRWKAEGVRDGVALAVIIMTDGRIWSAYPLPGSPGVRQNPRDR